MLMLRRCFLATFPPITGDTVAVAVAVVKVPSSDSSTDSVLISISSFSTGTVSVVTSLAGCWSSTASSTGTFSDPVVWIPAGPFGDATVLMENSMGRLVGWKRENVTELEWDS